jgi:hypothetical protein
MRRVDDRAAGVGEGGFVAIATYFRANSNYVGDESVRKDLVLEILQADDKGF